MEYLVINIEEKLVTSARFRVSRSSAELIGAASFDLGADQTLTDTAKLIASGAGTSQKVVLCLPPTLFAQRSVALPLKDLRKVREVMPSQLQGEIALPMEELILDVLPAGEGSFLAIWTKKAEIIRALELFREAGIEPQVISSAPFAWSCIPGLPSNCAVFEKSTLALIDGGKLTFFNTIDSASGAAMRIAAILSALGAIGTNVPQQLCLIGAGGESFGDSEALPFTVKQLTVPPDMGHLFKNEATFQQLAGLYAVAKTCHAGALPDFRRGELAWTAGDAKTRKKFLVTGVLAILVITILFVGKWLQYRAVNADIASLNTSISAMYREIFPNRSKAVDEISEVKGEIKRLAGTEASGSFLDILKKLAEAKGATINGLYEAEIEGRNLRIKGDARSAQAAGEFKTALSSLMSSVDLGEVKSRPDGTVSFSLTGTLKEAGK
jgi:general secretion pathway protein L